MSSKQFLNRPTYGVVRNEAADECWGGTGIGAVCRMVLVKSKLLFFIRAKRIHTARPRGTALGQQYKGVSGITGEKGWKRM